MDDRVRKEIREGRLSRRTKTRAGLRRLYGGIDPGKQGYMVLFDGTNPVSADPIPWLDTVPDYRQLDELFSVWKTQGCRFVMLEHQQPFGREGANSSFSLGLGYGALQAFLAAHALPYETIRPDNWKKEMGITVSPTVNGKKISPETRKKKLKAKSVAKAQALAPNFDFRASERARKAHDWKAEAFLLAVVAHRRVAGGS